MEQQVDKGIETGFNPAVLKDPEQRKAYSDTAMKAFLRMMDAWGMNVEQRCAILGDLPRPTYQKWARGGVSKLNRDQLERIGLTLGIFKGLKLVFSEEGGRMRWFKSPNHDYAFRGKSPAQRMTDGGMNDLYTVRAYIDGLRGAH